MTENRIDRFIFGAVVGLLFGVFSSKLGLVIGIMAGIAKELYDYMDCGTCDLLEMVFTWCGALLGVIMAYWLLRLGFAIVMCLV